MNLSPRAGYNPPIAGEIPREPEIGAAGLIRQSAYWMAYVSEQLPVFSEDNVIDRSGQAWCSKCGWQPRDAFCRDRPRSLKQGKPVLQRCCRVCEAKRLRELRARQQKQWKRY